MRIRISFGGVSDEDPPKTWSMMLLAAALWFIIVPAMYWMYENGWLTIH